jgi:hypothetical protein
MKVVARSICHGHQWKKFSQRGRVNNAKGILFSPKTHIIDTQNCSKFFQGKSKEKKSKELEVGINLACIRNTQNVPICKVRSPDSNFSKVAILVQNSKVLVNLSNLLCSILISKPYSYTKRK